MALLLRFVKFGSVAGFLDGGDELLHVHFALLDCDYCLVGMGNLSADDARNFFECRPHSFGTIDGSGHAGDLQVHSFVSLLSLGCLRVGCGRSGREGRGRTVSSCQQQSRTEQCC